MANKSNRRPFRFPRSLTYEERVAEVRIVSAPGAAIEIKEYTLTPAGQAALCGRPLPPADLMTSPTDRVDSPAADPVHS